MGKFVKRIVWTFLVFVIVAYVLYHICLIVFPNIKTETARAIQVFDSIDSRAYIIRDEKIIDEDLSGVVSFTLTDSEKVEKNGVIAKVYTSEEQASLSKKIQIIKDEINRLKNLKSFEVATSYNPESVNQQAYLTLNNIVNDVYNYDFNKLNKKRDEILYFLNEIQIVSGKDLKLDEKILELNNELDKLNSSNSNVKNILAKESGYFVGHSDGYESEFFYDDILKITSDRVESLFKDCCNNTKKNTAKLVTSSRWYAVCNLKKDEAMQLSIDQYVELFMPLVSSERIKAKVIAINQADKNSLAAVVFQCEHVDKNVLSIRSEPIKINIAEYKGLCVNKNAVHEKLLKQTVIDNETGEEKKEEKLVKGVYVRVGKQIIFKEIDIIFSGDDYVICSQNPDKAKLFSENTIKEYDEIVISGKDLYDGKFI